MAQEETIVGLDIGSTSIKVAVGQYTPLEDKQQKLNIIGAIEHEAEGINRGVITSIEDAVESVSKALDKTEKLIGLPIEQAWVSISGGHIISQISKGVVDMQSKASAYKKENQWRLTHIHQILNYELIDSVFSIHLAQHLGHQSSCHLLELHFNFVSLTRFFVCLSLYFRHHIYFLFVGDYIMFVLSSCK